MFVPLTTENQHITNSTKTEQQIRKFTLQQNLGEFNRFMHILRKGEILQRRAVTNSKHTQIYDSLSAFLANNMAAYPAVFTLIREIPQDGQSQVIVAQQFLKLLEAGFNIDQTQYCDLLRYVFLMMEQWNQKSSDSWVSLFGVLVNRKQFAVIEKETVGVLVRLSDARQILPIKIVALKCLGLLAETMKNRLKGVLLDRVRVYCRDPDKELKVIILKDVLPKLYQNLTNDLVGIYFTQRIFEMLYDPEIKPVALKLLLTHSEYFSTQERETRITQIMLEHLNSSNEQVQVILSELAGETYLKLRQYLQKNPKNSLAFLVGVIKMSESPKPQVRYNFLYNLPGLMYYLDLKLWLQAKAPYLKLLTDSSNQVRSIALLIFSQIIQLSGKNFPQYPTTLLSLLELPLTQKDQPTQKELLGNVYTGLYDSLDLIVGAIYRQILTLQQSQQSTAILVEQMSRICQLLCKTIQCANSLGKFYVSQKLHKIIHSCMSYFNIEQLKNEYLPIVISSLSTTDRISQCQSIKSLCQIVYLSQNNIDAYTMFSKSTRWSHRAIFLKIAKALLQSLSFAKYRASLYLSNDKVGQVRSECVLYVESCLRLYSLEPDQVLLMEKAITDWQKDKNLLVVEALFKLHTTQNAPQQQKQHWRMMRQLKNQEKCRHEKSLTNQYGVELQHIPKTTATIKKTTPTAKKHYSSKFASKLKSKINTSLSTNSLGFHSSLRSDPVIQRKTEQRECISANKDLADVMANFKKGGDQGAEPIIKKRRPSIDVTATHSNITNRRESFNLSRIPKRPPRGVVTQKKVQ